MIQRIGSPTRPNSLAAVHPFRDACESHDMQAAIALLADDVVFKTPAVFRPYRGRRAVELLLGAVRDVLLDFRYVGEIESVSSRDHVLLFTARVDELEVEGCDLLHTDDEGLIDEFTVMIRPLLASIALAEAMKRQLTPASVA